MIDIIIPVLAVAPHAVKIINGIQIRPQLIDILVSIKISRISLLHLFHMGIHYLGGTVDKSHLYHFLHGKS